MLKLCIRYKCELQSHVHVVTLLHYRSSISAQYQGNLTSNSFGNDPDSFLGNKYTTTVTLNNNGPSQIIGATLTISIPSFSTETGDYYYFYPSEFEVVS